MEKSKPVQMEKGEIRRFFEKNPWVAGVVVLLCLGGIYVFGFRGSTVTPEAFYSQDDGKTFYGGTYRVAPFMNNGREVAMALVYTCDGGKTKFVGYLLRYTPEGRPLMEKALANSQFNPGPFVPSEVKRPGDPGWTAAGGTPTGPQRAAATVTPSAPARTAAEIRDIRCPDGTPAELVGSGT